MKLPTPEKLAKQILSRTRFPLEWRSSLLAHAIREDREAIAKCVEEMRREVKEANGGTEDTGYWMMGDLLALLTARGVKP